MCTLRWRDRDAEGRVFLWVGREGFDVEEREVLDFLEAIAVGGYIAAGEVFVERETRGWWGPDGFSVLAFLLRASVEGEGDREREEYENEDYDGCYYAAVQAKTAVCCWIFEAEG
jgi:hypothetical protein